MLVFPVNPCFALLASQVIWLSSRLWPLSVHFPSIPITELLPLTVPIIPKHPSVPASSGYIIALNCIFTKDSGICPAITFIQSLQVSYYFLRNSKLLLSSIPALQIPILSPSCVSLVHPPLSSSMWSPFQPPATSVPFHIHTNQHCGYAGKGHQETSVCKTSYCLEQCLLGKPH